MTTLIPQFDLKNGGATPTGAVNRAINLKLAETVSVLDFGAVGDGVTDDSSAINAASLAANTNGQSLYFPGGTYIAKNLLIYTNSMWYGDGNASVIKLANSASSSDVLVKNVNCGTNINGSDATGNYNITIKDLAFDGNKANQTQTISSLYLRIVAYAVIDNCHFYNASGLAIDGCNRIDHNHITNCLFQNNNGNDIRILWVSNRNIITNNVIIGANLPVSDGGQNAAVTNDAIIISAVNVTASANFNCAENTIANNVIKGKVKGITLDGTFETIISGNQFGTQTSSSIFCQSTGTYFIQGLSITNNQITAEDTTDPAISVLGTRIKIVGNDVLSSLVTCVYLSAGSNNADIVISNNNLRFTAAQDSVYCIQLVDGGDVIVANNNCTYGKVGIYASGPTAGVEFWGLLISNNIIKSPSRQGIYIADGGTNKKFRSVTIQANQVINSGAHSTNAYDGIFLEQTTGVIADVHIDSNVIWDFNTNCKNAIALSGTINNPVVEPNQKAKGINGVIVSGYFSAAPTTDTWYAGQRISNFAPSSGGTEGWICTVGGTPGTWKTFGVIS